MFAIIEDGGRQYKVAPGEKIYVDLREKGGMDEKSSITFDRVLIANGGASSIIGQPLIDGATVTGEVVTPLQKGTKIEVQKFRRRKNSKRHTGHRQKYTEIEITGFNVPGLEIIETPPPAVEEAPPANETVANDSPENATEEKPTENASSEKDASSEEA